MKSVIYTIIASLFFYSCKNNPISSAIGLTTSIEQNAIASFISSLQVDSSFGVLYQDLYKQNNFEALWIDDDDRKASLLRELDEMKYDVPEVNFPEKENINSLPAEQQDLLLTYHYLKNALIFKKGMVVPKSVDTNYFISVNKNLPVDSLFTESGIMPLEKLRPSNIHYTALRNLNKKIMAVAQDSVFLNKWNAASDINNKVQILKDEWQLDLSHHVDTAALLGSKPWDYLRMKTLLNLERMRWLPHTFPQEYIHVNIPFQHLDYIKNGKSAFHTRAIVGGNATRTPALIDTLENIVFNPPWTVPFSIVEKEMRGRVSGKYKVFRRGKQVPNGSVNIKNYKNFTVQQPAGPSAALGYVKFNMPNRHHIYLHDTPNRNLFGNKKRTLSHGCVRVEHPRVLASMLLSPKGYDASKVDSAIAKGKTYSEKVEHMMVYLTYLTASVDYNTNFISFYKDVYQLDDKLKNALFATK